MTKLLKDSSEEEDNKSVETLETTESYTMKIKEAQLMLEKDASRKKKRKTQQEMETISEVLVEVEQEISQQKEIFSKPMEAVMVSTSVSSKSSVTTNVTTELMNRYVNTCGDMGIIDTLDTQEQHFKKMTRQYVWRYFKLVDEDQYNFGTAFVTFICNQCNRDIIDSKTPDWWNGIKHFVQRAMMDMRSSCTQAMKRSFLGKSQISLKLMCIYSNKLDRFCC
jgi:phenylalanyl-tRNA synthetase alpha subunit